MPIYVKYDVINGDVTEAGHVQWIEVNSFQWGVGRDISSPTGGAADRESSAPSVSEIVVTKPTDIATVKLLGEAAAEGDGKDVTIDFCKTYKGNLSVYLSFVLNNTMISGYSLSSGGDRPQESLSFNFTKVMMTDVGLGAKNDEGQPATVGYDLGLGNVLPVTPVRGPGGVKRRARSAAEPPARPPCRAVQVYAQGLSHTYSHRSAKEFLTMPIYVKYDVINGDR